MFRSKIIAKARALVDDTRGGALILVSLAAPLMLGGLAMSADVGYWYTSKRQTQQQADTAVLAAARVAREGNWTVAGMRDVALRDAVRNGFANAAPNVLTLNWPPTSGAYAGQATAVEVIIQRQVASFFAKFFGRAAVTTHARAVASLDAIEACVLALSTSASRALNISGTTTIIAPNCAFATNSTASDSVVVGGSSFLTIRSISTSGDVSINGSITVDEPTLTHQSAIKDPYAGLALPAVGACNHNNFHVNGGGNTTINPGVYCGGIQMNGSGTLYMNKGTYILNRGDFDLTGSGRIRCGNCTAATDGVTIALTATSGQVGSVHIGGSGDIELAAPSDPNNPYYGVLFYQDRNASAGNNANLNGGSAMKLSGAIYMPKAGITYAGSSAFAMGKNCVVVIGLTAAMTGSSGFNQADCKAMGSKPGDVSRGLRLLE